MAPAPVLRPSGLGLHAAAHQLLASAGRNIDPGILLAVAPRRPRARRVGRLAVVLARLRDAIALLRVELGLGGRTGLAAGDQGDRESGHNGGCDEQVPLHVDSPSAGYGLAPCRMNLGVWRLIVGGIGRLDTVRSR